jgi:hypothetical protein
MNNSLASYLVPIFLSSDNKIRGVRFFYDGKKVWDVLLDVIYRGELVVKSALGSPLKMTTEYVSGKGTVVKAGDPFHSPLQTFIREHLKTNQGYLVDPDTAEISKFTAKVMNCPPAKNYYDPPSWSEGETLEIAWEKPWNLEADGAALSAMCRDDKSNLPMIIKELFKCRYYQSVNRFLKHGRWSSNNMSLSVGSCSSFVFMKNGAVYDYRNNKVLADNLDSHMRSLWGKPEDTAITWEDYCQNLFIKGLPLKVWMKHIQIKEDTLNLAYQHQFWDCVKMRIMAKMPFYHAQPYKPAATGDLEVFAFDSVNGKMESYLLGKYGFQRTFDAEPQKKNRTVEETEIWLTWRRALSSNTFQALLDRPGISWFGRIKSRHSMSSLEPIQIVL